MTTTEPQEQDDVLDGFDSTAGVMAYIYSKEGAEGLRQLLEMAPSDRKSLERDAEELKAVGLPLVADIVLEFADRLPENANPFDPETDAANWRDWNRRVHGNFEGYYLDDDERAARAMQLKPAKEKYRQ
jgi:hypothetical protein